MGQGKSIPLKFDDPGVPIPILTFGSPSPPPRQAEIVALASQIKDTSARFLSDACTFFTIVNPSHVIPWSGAFPFLNLLQRLTMEALTVSVTLGQLEEGLSDSISFLNARLHELEMSLEILQDDQAPTTEMAAELSTCIAIMEEVLPRFQHDSSSPTTSVFYRKYHVGAQLLLPIVPVFAGIVLIAKHTVIDTSVFDARALDLLLKRYTEELKNFKRRCVMERVKAAKIKAYVVKSGVKKSVYHEHFDQLPVQFPNYFGQGMGQEDFKLERSQRFHTVFGSSSSTPSSSSSSYTHVELIDGWDPRKVAVIAFSDFEIPESKGTWEERRDALYPQALLYYRKQVVELLEKYFKPFL